MALNIQQAMLMTAGRGTRLAPFTDDCPKPFLPLMGVPTLQFGVDHLRAAGVRSFVANVHYLPQLARQALAQLDWEGGGIDVGVAGESAKKTASALTWQVSDESLRLLGSAGGIARGSRLLKPEPFFLMNGDVVCDLSLQALADRHHELRASRQVELTLGLVVLAPHQQQGKAAGIHGYRSIEVDEVRGLVTGLGERSQDRAFFSGIAVVEPSGLVAKLSPDQPADFVEALLGPAIHQGKVGYWLAPSAFSAATSPAASTAWFDTGSPRDWWLTHLTWMRLLGESSRWGGWAQAGRARWKARVESQSGELAAAGNGDGGGGVWVANQWLGMPSLRALSLQAPFFLGGLSGGSGAPQAEGSEASAVALSRFALDRFAPGTVFYPQSQLLAPSSLRQAALSSLEEEKEEGVGAEHPQPGIGWGSHWVGGLKE